MLETALKSTIRSMPTGMAFAVARYAASRPKRPPMSETEAAAMELAVPILECSWSNNAAWSWGNGPCVLLVHGWGGRASQMAHIGVSLASRGMRAIAFDVAGHGESGENVARWRFFIRDICRMSRTFGPVAGYIGHSAGGLSMMAARRSGALTPSKFVCICAPSHPHPPIRGLAQRLNPREAVLDCYRKFLGEEFQITWSALETGEAFADAGPDLLLCYDHKDRFVDHSDGDKIHARCPGSKLLKSSAHGHTRILAAPDVISAAVDFVAPAALPERPQAPQARILG